ncbi:hypothetical protein [Clostridium oryzae]|uniref:Polysaccharide deacetylase n=1 Tax=Clostridium oryzae TaxID=1450648 RepID=A0A1V4IFC4_9CLOT|nr:hypothetical protein [Clostridium oryzae]OPJ58355.1 hypothetical protein CLORY_36490 [Clostridium oryzae]
MFEFSYETYSKIIKEMKKINKIYNFKSADSSVKNGFLLRHDVDIDLDKAYKMCSIEKNIGITSTYFLLVTSDFYNVLSYENRKLVSNMFSDGFEIALHFDPMLYGDISLEQMQKQVEKECSIIEDIIGERVQTISLHNPSIHNRYLVFKTYKNAYAGEFFTPELYLSDSCKDFRGKDVFEFIKKGKSNLLQVLFHPIHFSENGENYIKSFSRLIEDKINNFDKYVRINKTYKNEIKENTLLSCFQKHIKENCGYEEKV